MGCVIDQLPASDPSEDMSTMSPDQTGGLNGFSGEEAGNTVKENETLEGGEEGGSANTMGGEEGGNQRGEATHHTTTTQRPSPTAPPLSLTHGQPLCAGSCPSPRGF